MKVERIMKRPVIASLLIICSLCAVAQKSERDYSTLKSLSWGIGMPVECVDLPGAGVTLRVGYDCAYPINDRFAMGFYLSGGGGLWSEFRRVYDEDNEHIMFRLTVGVMMAVGDLKNRPFVLGCAPATGFGLYDMDLVLPLEIRFGRYITDRWYIMGEVCYGISLADETACIEPAIRVGYNFGRKKK